MRPRAAVIDTNVLVAGPITGDPSSPTARVLDGMLEGRLVYLLSPALLAEYRRVLLRPKIRRLHELAEREVDSLLTEVVANAVVREPESSGDLAPNPGDQHLWDLLSTETRAVLVTGDRDLIRNPPDGYRILAPADFVAAMSS